MEENDLFEFPEEELGGSETSELDSKALLNSIKQIHALLKKISAALGQKYPVPAKGAYPYPKKMQAWIENPEEFTRFEKEIEQKEKDYQVKIEELEAKVKEFEDQAKGAKITELLDIQTEKGLISEEMRPELARNYESFSIEQIESISKNIEQMNFSKAKAKSQKSQEIPKAESKDFAKRKEELTLKLKDLDQAHVRGPLYDQYKQELEELSK